ncbi:hypothetical protein BD289DRAFT_369101 [Coniella lustricola]|uniref:Transmembrane protein 135 N-terminal domain-containing protein n=1 Tax=Coniella lustricola TaxID=2025994 RepID=A0A2T3A790_9PEZI|nr:hypothetical protein BD289DRAFT_369101 [Coniella lustricola]
MSSSSSSNSASAVAAAAAVSSEGAGGPSSRRNPGISAKATSDPVLRNTLRYTISAREYALLHRYILSRSRQIKKRVPTVETVNKIMNGDPSVNNLNSRKLRRRGSKGKERQGSSDNTPLEVKDVGSTSAGAGAGAGAMVGADDYNARAVRHSLRVFGTTAAAMKLYGLVAERFLGAKRTANKQPFHKSPIFKLSLSLSSILLLYRFLYRFFWRLRMAILDSSSEPFRRRNPRVTRTLTSIYTPAIGASMAGIALGISPPEQLRVSIAIYAAFRALEFGWNCVEDAGMVWGREKSGRLKMRPWWFGSWMMQPFAFGQLLHAFVFDYDCFPTSYGGFIMKNSSAYIHTRPTRFPANLTWPSTRQVVDSLGQMAKLNWPPHVSPILFPDKEQTLPQSLTQIAPITDPAHPLIKSLSCALLHPEDPSCTKTFITFWARSFPLLARFFLIINSALMVPRYKALYHSPVTALYGLILRVLRMSTFVTGSISTAWASICFFQNWFPRAFLPTQRFFLGGFLAGFWGWVERKRGRGVFLYSARVSVDSLWKVGVKRRWWKAMRAGDVWVFVLAVMITGMVYEKDAEAVREESWRKGISWIRGQGFRDWALEAIEDAEEEAREREREREAVAAAAAQGSSGRRN